MPISSPPKKWISLSEIHAFLKFECIINFYRLRCMMFHKRDNKGKWWWQRTWDSACSRYFCTKKTKKKKKKTSLILFNIVRTMWMSSQRSEMQVMGFSSVLNMTQDGPGVPISAHSPQPPGGLRPTEILS